jgi:hypothetical protein
VEPAADFIIPRNQNHSVLLQRAVKLVGQPPTGGQGGETHCVFPDLSMGTALARSTGIGAADCPQIQSTCSAWRQAASAVTVVDWPR